MTDATCTTDARPAATPAIAVAAAGNALGAALRPVPGRLLDALFAWRERALQRRRLLQLDARMLSDIGLSRADAENEAAKPFWRP